MKLQRILLVPIFLSLMVSMLPLAQAQKGGFMFENDIHGTYTDSETGLSIDFPEGWSGLEFLGFSVIVAPGGIDFISEQEVTMIIMSLGRAAVEDMWNSPGDFDAMSGDDDAIATQKCDSSSASFTRINGMSTMQIEQECTTERAHSSKSKISGFITSNHFILVGYQATSAEAYDRHVADFDTSLRSLQITGTQDFRSGMVEMQNLRSNFHTVTALGSPVDVSIQSNSQITNLQFIEEEKRLSFTVEGEDGAVGVAVVSISSILEPPYTVTVDGQIQSDVSEIVDEDTGELLLMISYDHSVHEVSVTGANVVPEFHIGILAAAGLVMSGMIVSSRFYKGV